MQNIKKKTRGRSLLSFALAILLTVGLFPAMTPTAQAAEIDISPMVIGVGTEENPIMITDASQLAELAALVNGSATNDTWAGKYYKLANDIDLSGYANWTPIGINSTYPFKGSFDGGGFVVKNLKITGSAENRGLFGYTSGATIKNFGVINASINGDKYVGGIVGSADNGTTVKNCYITGKVTGTRYVGGIVGYALSSTTHVTNCYSAATVSASSGTNNTRVGGVVGFNEASVTYCYSTGAVSGKTSDSAYSYTGGVVGHPGGSSTVSNCVALNPSVRGYMNTSTADSSRVGRITGNTAGTLTNNYAFSGTLTGSGGYNGANAPAANIIDSTIWTTAGWDNNTSWTIAANSLPILKTTDGKVIGGQDGIIPGYIIGTTDTGEFFAGGTGADAEHAYEINTAEQLAQLAAVVNVGNTSYNAAYYKLTADIDLAGYSNWTPIGISNTYPFKGSFDGGGYVVRNLTINSTSDFQGLFGYVDNATAKITNVGLVNVNIKCGANSGGLAGYVPAGIISNCYVTGTVSGTGHLGGLVGYHYAGTLSNCYSAATVSGSSNYVGGLLGRAGYSTVSVSFCYATGAVNNGSYQYTGGVVGGNSGALSNCVALNKSVTSSGTNFGRVTGGGGTLSKLVSYENTLLNGAAVTGAANEKNGLNTSAADIANGTYSAVWGSSYANMVGNANWTVASDKLPALKTTTGTTIGGQDLTVPGHISGVYFAGAGTSGDSYRITTAAQLAQLATLVNAGDTSYNSKYYKLMNDIDLSGYANWTPIGSGSTYPFKGNFDGDGYVIKNLTINASSDNQGLFGYTSGATIQNLGVVNLSITSSKYYIGGVVGYASNTRVSRCYTTGTLTGTPYTGGVVGLLVSGSTVTNCYSSAKIVTTSNNTGGVVGYCNSNDNTVEYSYAIGAVSCSGTNIGGVVGNSTGSNVTNCVALNLGVSATGASYGRVVGNGTTLTNNYAWSAMPGTWSAKILTGKDGADMTGTQAMTASFWQTAANWNTAAWDANIWTFRNGYLPVLKGIAGQTGDAGLYLGIYDAEITVTYDANGGVLGSVPMTQIMLAGKPGNLTGEEPLREGHTFLGWSKDPSATAAAYIKGSAYTGESDVMLYAVWTLINTKVTEVNDDTTGDIEVSGNTSNLEEVYDRVVTSQDTAAGSVSLSLNITDSANQSEINAIKQLADKGSEVYFFDVTLTKTVDGTPENLTTVPVPVEIHIALTGDLADRTYYRVYRYHGGVAEQLSSDPLCQEYYRVDIENSEIIIYTMKFSTYAIFGNDAPIDLGTGYDVDVQAKITGAGGAIYKIDLAWGAMTFEYSTSGVWNPDTHSYDSNTHVGWLDEGFMHGNNQITAWNHSNSDVEANFTITQPSLTGVTMEINRSNVLGGIAAENMELSRVPKEGEAAPSIDAFLLLDGEPNNVASALNSTYAKIAVITVTIETVMGSQLTPKGTP